MANKKLGKVVAGAALGGASLLVFTPGIAFADSGHHDGDGGKVFAKPHVVRAGEEVTLIEVCEESQQDAFVWSKVTGRVELHKVDKDKDEHGKGKDEHGKDEHGKGKDEHGKDEHGKGKDEHGKGEMGRGEEHGKGEDKDKDKGKDEHGKGEEGRPGGWGGGADASGREDWGGYEHGQKPEDEKGAKGRDEDMRTKDEDKGRHEDKSAKDEDKWGKDDDKGRHEDDKWGKDEDDSWEHGRDFVYLGEAKVDKDARPGRYELHGSCGEGELVVLPKGHVDGGDGGMTSTSTNRTMATTGAGLLGASALGGLVLLRRRRTDGSVA
ncbi:hypothetical protein [Micromonospora sp. NPDC048830]|uniref:hypothetical protein n=1 Tax=Micromonospora sp. NPDC048830 TaxID=3364257 RepID=UPI00370FD307